MGLYTLLILGVIMKVSEVMQEFVPCEICGNKNIKIYSSLYLSSRGCFDSRRMFEDSKNF